MTRPYAIPHDQEGAGLRDYLPSVHVIPPRPRWPWILLLGFALGFLAHAELAAAETIAFIQPRVHVVNAPPTGVDVPVQIRIVPSAANRAYAIAWCDGAHAHTLDGADEATVQPTERPLLVRVGPGQCEFVASVFGAGGAVRARASFVLHVCGGQENCIPGGQP